MLEKAKEERYQVELICLDELVPKDHLLRKIDNAVDFSKIYEFVEDLYCHDNGRPSVDPVVLFKMVMIQHLFGIPSLRKTAEEVRLNVAYRWFLGYSISESTPHFATVSYNFKHRFTDETIEKVFFWILSEIETAGYLSPESVFVDGTHIRIIVLFYYKSNPDFDEKSGSVCQKTYIYIKKEINNLRRSRTTIVNCQLPASLCLVLTTLSTG